MVELKVGILTASMGNCWSGDCWCDVYENGDIKYDGLESWQCSRRVKPRFERWTNKRGEKRYADNSVPSSAFQKGRAYGSEITMKDYQHAMRVLAVMKKGR